MMDAKVISRDICSGGDIKLSAGGSTFIYHRPRAGILLVTISGLDIGQFGTTTLDEISAAINRDGKIELFIDAQRSDGAVVAVSEEWTRFFASNREKLSRVHVLVGSEVLKLIVSIAQHLSRTGNLIQIHTSEEIFFQKLQAAG